MSTSTTLTRAQKRDRAVRAARRYHPTFAPKRIRPGSPIDRVIRSRMARHTANVAAMQRVHTAAMRARGFEILAADRLLSALFGTTTPGCEDCQRPVMDTLACDVKPHALCLDCCGCPEHQA